jgi:MYXO-CTERM domain-containing protein
LSAFDVYIPFSQLQGTASTSHVDSITFVFNGANHWQNIDYEITRICTVVHVPEPASGTLLMTACGILGLAAYAARRRRRGPRSVETG